MFKRLEILISACFYYTGLVKLARWWAGRRGQRLVILCYHRASGGDLRRHLLYLRSHYRILHLEAALRELYATDKAGRRESERRRPPLVLAFDDGNQDNYTHGFKLARELQVPLTIFLIPGYIESRGCFWWLEGDHLVSHAQVSEATVEGRTYRLDKLDERKALAQAIYTRARYATSISERETFLDSVRQVLAGSLTGQRQAPPLEVRDGALAADALEEHATLPLTWTEVQEMEASGWVSFGAHTMHHPILTCLTDPAEVQYEVTECRTVLERQLGHPVRTFAYPFGGHEHIGENGSRAVKQAGYTWALTTLQGCNTPETDPYFIRRVLVDVDQHWLSIAAKASGVWHFFTSLHRLPMARLRKYLTGNQRR